MRKIKNSGKKYNEKVKSRYVVKVTYESDSESWNFSMTMAQFTKKCKCIISPNKSSMVCIILLKEGF